jgi:DNA modification methylase
MLHCGDCLDVLKTLPDCSVNCCITSPPYFGLRDYGVDGQIGLEPTPDKYVQKIVAVFREVRRVLKEDGTLWLNLGDSYAGSGKGAWDVSDEVKKAAGTKEAYLPRKRAGGTGIGDTAKTQACERSAGMDRNYSLKPKDLIGIPWRVAFALQADGWYLRQDIIWHKPNAMPESVTDRCTKSHEYIFLLSKNARYYYDAEAIKQDAKPEHFARYKTEFWKEGTKEHSGAGRPNNARNTPGIKDVLTTRNRRSVWTVSITPFRGAHFATFPEDLIEPMIKAGCPVGGTVLDPFFGSGTTGRVAIRIQREYIGIELNPIYCDEIASKRTKNVQREMFV